MALRKIVEIDEERCDGCGLCVSSCAEGAIQVINGKARLVREEYCDGLGACLGECPRGALRVMEREAADFDPRAVAHHLALLGRQPIEQGPHAPGATERKPLRPVQTLQGCPGSAMHQFAEPPGASSPAASPSALRQWPIQLHLVSPQAPYYQGADLLLAADCTAFACGDFHARYLEGRALAIACPKLDDPSGYVEKLAALIRDAGVRTITVVRMQVPCCGGLERLVEEAMTLAGCEVPIRRVVVGLQGKILRDEGA